MTTSKRETSPIEQWLDQPDTPLEDPRDQALAERLDELRIAYSGLRCRTAPPESLARQESHWRLPALGGAMAVLLVSVLLIQPGDRVPAPTETNWSPDSPAARLRSISSQFPVDLATPQKPDDFEFRLPERPTRRSGFSAPADPPSDSDPQAALGHRSQRLG